MADGVDGWPVLPETLLDDVDDDNDNDNANAVAVRPTLPPPAPDSVCRVFVRVKYGFFFLTSEMK